MKEYTICDNLTYNSSCMQDYINSRRQDADKQWINVLIDTGGGENEIVYTQTDEFLLCRDIHPGNDERFLLVFRDKELKTIRDLQAKHIPLLKRTRQAVNCFLAASDRLHKDKWYIFFHYTPSVFQLHAHVSTLKNNMDNSRKHPISTVIRNLESSETYYKHAMILTPLCRSLKHLNLYTSIKA